LLRYGLNQQPDVRYSLKHLPKAGPWLMQYWQQSGSKGLAKATEAMLPLIEKCVSEHDLLAEPAGMTGLIQDSGWVEVYRTAADFDKAQRDAAALGRFKLNYRVLDKQQVHALEPGLTATCWAAFTGSTPRPSATPAA
jgi:D-amino-acid dehydrogenase